MNLPRPLKRSAALALFALLVAVSSAVANNIERDGSGYIMHWGRGSLPYARVYFADTTSSRWPVSISASYWNETASFGSYYNWNYCQTPCVWVYDASYGTGTYRGWAVLPPLDASHHLVGGSGGVRIYLNDSFTNGSYLDRVITCQELGHAIGLAHQVNVSGTTSCMAYGHSSTYGSLPDAHDYSMMTGSIYNH